MIRELFSNLAKFDFMTHINFTSIITLLSSFFEHGRTFFVDSLALCSDASSAMFHSLQALPEDVKKMINVSTLVYGIIIILCMMVKLYKYFNNQIDYRSKVGIGFIVFNVLHFFATTILSLRLIFNIGIGYYHGVLDGGVIGYQFHTLVLASMFMYIPLARLPSVFELFVEHLMIPLSIMLQTVWSNINVVYILTNTLSVFLSPFFGHRAYYLTILSNLINAVMGVYSYVYMNNVISGIVSLHSMITLLICAYALTHLKAQEKQIQQQSRDEYKRKMDAYLQSIKGDKKKEKELKKALQKFAVKGVSQTSIGSRGTADNRGTVITTASNSQYMSKKKLKQLRKYNK